MNRSFRAAELQMQAPVQQQRQGRSLGAVMKDKEEDLALFLEMRKREKERNSLLLLHTSEDFDPPLGSKPGGSPIFKIVSSTPRKTASDDFLNSHGFLRHLVLLFFLLWKWSQTNPPWIDLNRQSSSKCTEVEEYAMGGKPTHGDVYNYGILLLEMITGKGPTDDMFKDNLSLHFAKLALAERVMDIVDPQLLLEEAEVFQGNENQINARNRMHDCLISMVKISVLCSVESPRKRMQMRDVVAEMQTIKDLYLGVKIRQDKLVRS